MMVAGAGCQAATAVCQEIAEALNPSQRSLPACRTRTHPHSNESLREVEAFQQVAKTGEATPSCRQPGQKPLKPGPDPVGKVREMWKP
jgi:hypothetical protein